MIIISDLVEFEELRTSSGAYCGIATLNVPTRANALSLTMVRLLTSRLVQWQNDPNIVLVILRGTGTKGFCAGGDLKAIHSSLLIEKASSGSTKRIAAPYLAEFFSEEYCLDYMIHRYTKPVLCWGHGFVMGGGLGLMAGASHRVVTETSSLAMPEVAIGFFPDVGHSYVLSRMPEGVGKFLGLTGAQIGPADAIFVGWANYAVHTSNYEGVINALVHQPWTSQRQENDILLSKILKGFEGSFVNSVGPLQSSVSEINAVFAKEDIHEISKLSKQYRGCSWLTAAIGGLFAGSPEAVKLAFELQRRAFHLTLSDVLHMEYVAALNFAIAPDFTEGIRAKLVDRNNPPKWRAADVDHVSDERIFSFFKEPDSQDHSTVFPLRPRTICQGDLI